MSNDNLVQEAVSHEDEACAGDDSIADAIAAVAVIAIFVSSVVFWVSQH